MSFQKTDVRGCWAGDDLAGSWETRAFHLGQNANPLQVSVSGQPTKHRKCLRERDVLDSTAVPRRGGAGSRGT